MVAALFGRQPHLMQRLLTVDNNFAAVLKTEVSTPPLISQSISLSPSRSSRRSSMVIHRLSARRWNSLSFMVLPCFLKMAAV
jgi:hypothetical protein